MRCPSCGASYSDAECCEECGVFSASEPNGDHPLPNGYAVAPEVENLAKEAPGKSTLIEFPGVTRNTVPEWRRELSERVREVQERRAREAAQEAVEAERRRLAQEAAAAMRQQLELLPQVPAPPLNPIVAAALRRIERANHQPTSRSSPVQPSNARVAALAYDADDVFESIVDTPSPKYSSRDTEGDKQRENPVVVTAPANAKVNRPKSSTGAKRLLREDDGVLDYLVTVPATIRPEEIRERQAGIPPRIVAAFVDLVVCVLLFSPFAAVVELTNGEWLEVRTAFSALGFGALVLFLYLTFATALTGRTLGMRMLSLRTVDRKTGLIPTGSQSVGRAVISLASLFALGLPMLYALIQGDGHTAQDRLTGTVVVRA
jgi:uncharacterized RDD family membrane protein YckC